MRTYAGRRLHGKRNPLKNFEPLYTHEPLPLTGDRLRDAAFVLKDWSVASGQGIEDTDYHPYREALRLYETLALCGAITRMESLRDL